MKGSVTIVKRFGRRLAGIPLTGDPSIDVGVGGADVLLIPRACQYAAAMVFGAGSLDEGMRSVDAYFVAPSTVIFVRADASQAEIARYTVPERVMSFDPGVPAVRLPAREAVPA